MDILGYIVLALFAATAVTVYFRGKRKPSEDKLQKQKRAYEELLKKYNVPENHYKIVIGQSRVYSVYNCPALIWKEKDMVKLLVLRQKEALSEEEEADFLYLASQPYVDFKRFDGSYFPDWAIQSDYVKELFLPYVNLSKTVGGLDYQQQMYWIGTICVYAKSLAQILTMLGRPLSDYENRVEHKPWMLIDKALPQKMQEELKRELGVKKEDSLLNREEGRDGDSLQAMEKAIQVIRSTERKAGEEAAADRINRLYARLLADKRYEDLEKATQDEEYRAKLFEELEASTEDISD